MNRKEEYNNYLLLSKYSPNTYYIYNKYAQELFTWHPNGILKQEDVNKLIANHNHRVYRAFIKGYVEHFNDSHIKVPKIKGRVAQKRLRHLTEKEVSILIRELPQRESVLVELMFMTGLRISEAVNLRGKDIDQDKMTIKGVGKGNKEFEQPITKTMFDRLYKLAVVNNRTLEKTIFYYEDVKSPRKKALYELQKNAKELLGKHVTPHMLRHSCGTYLHQQGWDLREVQVFLRHSQLETTTRYTHVDGSKLRTKWGGLFK